MEDFVPAKYCRSDKSWKVNTEKTTLEFISPYSYLALEANHKCSAKAGVPSELWKTSATTLLASW